MRGAVAGLASPHPLAETLPTLLREDPVARALCGGLDEVLAPVLATLDSFPAYLDLTTTPADLLPWLAQWLGMTLDPDGDLDQARLLLGRAAELQALGGTAAGLARAVEAAHGVGVEVRETGGAGWSELPGGELPGVAGAAVVVVVRPQPDQVVDLDRIEALVAELAPAHVAHRVEVVDG